LIARLKIWSGNWLMDLDEYQALRAETKTIDGGEYLFVEAGNFKRREQHGTEVAWQVFSR
jgi:hypothetical protein